MKKNDQLRVNEWELSDLNPGKQFLTDFTLAECGHVHTTPIEENHVVEIGEKGARLASLVAKIHGVRRVNVSSNELRVFKLATHSWEELSIQIREAFEVVYGDHIVFQKENTILLRWRRIKLILKS